MEVRILKKIIKIAAILIAIVVIGIFIFASVNSTSDEQLNTDTTLVKVNEVARSVFYAPQYVAITLGFYDLGISLPGYFYCWKFKRN